MPLDSSVAAKLAAEHVELAINTLVDVMRMARRNDQHRVAAARAILDLAGAATASRAGDDSDPVDMLDPVSIRRYTCKQLALNVSPTASELSRLTMMNELADELEAGKAKAEPPKVDTPDELAAARARLRASLGNDR